MMKYFLVLYIFVFISCSSTQTTSIPTTVFENDVAYEENLLTLIALDLQIRQQSLGAIRTYSALNKKYPNINYVNLANLSVKDKKSAVLFFNLFSKSLKVRPLLELETFMKIGEFKKANTLALDIVKTNKSFKVHNNVYLSFLFLKQYKKALPYAKIMYIEKDTLANLGKILYVLDILKQQKLAKQYLEKALDKEDCKVAKRCVFISKSYARYKDYDKVLDVYIKIFKYNKTNEFTKKIVSMMLINKHYKRANSFLKNNKKLLTKEELYKYYYYANNYTKAIETVKEAYTKDKRKKHLGYLALFIYDVNEDREKEILEYFEEALPFIKNNSMLLNAYGYFLIDKNIDVKEGLNLVKEALKLKKLPVYLDSLAWGYYKIQENKKAWIIINEIYGVLKNSKEFMNHYGLIKAKH